MNYNLPDGMSPNDPIFDSHDEDEWTDEDIQDAQDDLGMDGRN